MDIAEIFDHRSMAILKGNLGSQVISSLSSSPVLLGVLFVLFNFYRWITETMSWADLDRIANKLKRGRFCDSSLSMTGEVRQSTNGWSRDANPVMSDQFRAILWECSKVGPSAVREVSEFILGGNREYRDEAKMDVPSRFFLTATNRPFLIAPDIHCSINRREVEREQRDCLTKVCTVTITLTSPRLNAAALSEYVDDVSKSYRLYCEDATRDKLFIYRYTGVKKEDERSPWTEVEFESFRTFDNLFFEGKKEMLETVNRFRDGEEWYRKHGHPYTLGVGLHGPPGTGKSSLIKALANHLRRHIVEIPLGVIESEEEFYQAYFETKYNRSGRAPLRFADKIICFEDIDGQSSLTTRSGVKEKTDATGNMQVLLRNLSARAGGSGSGYDTDMDSQGSHDRDCVQGQNKSVKELLEEAKASGFVLPSVKTVERRSPISISTMLNALDGIRENVGRLAVITSNRYAELDPAITRAGRIDVEQYMGAASIDVLSEMVAAHYGRGLSKASRREFRGIKLKGCDVTAMFKTAPTHKAFLSKLRNLSR